MLEKFEQLMISEPVLRALNDMGFEEPTPIQQEAIPVAMSGKDNDWSKLKQVLVRQQHLACLYWNA